MYWVCNMLSTSIVEGGEEVDFFSKLEFSMNISYIRHEDFLLLLLRPSRSGDPPPPGFWKGLDWRALGESCPPNIGKLKLKKLNKKVIFWDFFSAILIFWPFFTFFLFLIFFIGFWIFFFLNFFWIFEYLYFVDF